MDLKIAQLLEVLRPYQPTFGDRLESGANTLGPADSIDIYSVRFYHRNSESAQPLRMDELAIFVREDADLDELNQLMKAKAFYAQHANNTLEEIIEDVYTGIGVESILRSLAQRIRNPILACGADHRVIAHTCDQKAIETAIEECLEKVCPAAREPFTTDLGESKQLLVFPVWSKNHYFGALCTYQEARPLLLAEDIPFLQPIARILSPYFKRFGAFTCGTLTVREKYLRNLLERDFSAENNMQLSFPRKMYVMIIGAENDNRLDLHGLQQECFAIFQDAYSLIKGNRLMLVINAAQNALSEENTYNKLQKLTEQKGLIAAVSHQFSEINELKRYYQQAQSAYDTRARALAGPQIIKYADCVVDRLIKTYAESDGNLEELYHPAYLSLIEYDKTYRTNYREFLDLYILHNGNMSICAKILNVHYNTVKYRINIIKDLTGESLADKNIISALNISQKVYEYINCAAGNRALAGAGVRLGKTSRK